MTKIKNAIEDVVRLKFNGLTNREIADRLGTHIKTVEYHVSKLKKSPEGEVEVKIKPIAVKDWFKTSSGKFARVLLVGRDTITVSIHDNIVGAMERLDGSNQADFNSLFIMKKWVRVSQVKN